MTLEQAYEYCRAKLLGACDMATARTTDGLLVTLQKIGVDDKGEMVMRMRVRPA